MSLAAAAAVCGLAATLAVVTSRVLSPLLAVSFIGGSLMAAGPPAVDCDCAGLEAVTSGEATFSRERSLI